MNQSDPPEEGPTLFTRMFGAAHYFMTLAVLAIFVGATVLLFEGIVEMGYAVWHRFFADQSVVTDSVSLRVAVIESVDVILVATVLYVIAFGLYQLFVDPALRSTLPPWLRISTIGNLEVRLTGMVITVLSIIALTQALEAHGGGSGSGIGFEIAAVIAAISLFLFQEHRKHGSSPNDEE
jgi:uncharacterized membrane protein YqhA